MTFELVPEGALLPTCLGNSRSSLTRWERTPSAWHSGAVLSRPFGGSSPPFSSFVPLSGAGVTACLPSAWEAVPLRHTVFYCSGNAPGAQSWTAHPTFPISDARPLSKGRHAGGAHAAAPGREPVFLGAGNRRNVLFRGQPPRNQGRSRTRATPPKDFAKQALPGYPPTFRASRF